MTFKMHLLPRIQRAFDTLTDCYPHDPVLVYIGIGTANNATQQWPPFIAKLYEQFPSLHVIVLLVDPVHEQPPLAANVLRLNYDEHGHSWHKDRLTMLVNTNAIHSYADLNRSENSSYNVTPDLHFIVQFCISQQFTMLYHDYTGRINGDLATYMEPRIKSHMDHIIFGWGQRDRASCTIDLFESHIMQMPVWLDWTTLRPVLRWFNVFHFVYNPENLTDYWSNTSDVDMERQFKHFDQVCLQRLIEDVLPPLRVLRREPPQLQAYHLDRLCGDDVEPYRLLKAMKYDDLAVYLYDKAVKEFDAIVKYRDWAVDGYDFFMRVTQSANPYAWANVVRDMIEIK